MTIYLQPATYGANGADFAPPSGNHGPLEALVSRAAGQLSLLMTWNERARQRRRLGQLDDRLLADIGVSRAAAAHEAAKRPWEA